VHERLDPLGLQVEETAAAAWNAGVVDEELDRRMAARDLGGDPFDARPVGDVAALVLGPDLVGDLAQAFLAAREQDELPAARRKSARDRRADAARTAGDDGDAAQRQTRTVRFACAWPPR
jgi:hypothetical protein